MRPKSLQGVTRGRKRTTIPDELAKRPNALVNRDFTVSRPNALWPSDITHVSNISGLFFVAFVIHALALRIVGWRVSSSLHSNLLLDALVQALHARERGRRL